VKLDTIERKTMLYKSGLGFYCINHVQGCSHGCLYPCYAYMMAHSYGRAKTYADWCRPTLVANAVEVLTKELDRKRQKPETVNLCLTTDPFMTGYPEVTDMSLKLIALLNSRGIRCSVLTKGTLPSDLADRERFPSDNLLGISLVSLSEEFRRRWEPGARPYADRLRALKALHDRGCRTFAHMEPYPTPNIIEQDLRSILEAAGFVDSIYFGGWNYNSVTGNWPGRKEFYRECAASVRRFCGERAIECALGAEER
jgi:DNA repair photolyase